MSLHLERPARGRVAHLAPPPLLPPGPVALPRKLPAFTGVSGPGPAWCDETLGGSSQLVSA